MTFVVTYSRISYVCYQHNRLRMLFFFVITPIFVFMRYLECFFFEKGTFSGEQNEIEASVFVCSSDQVEMRQNLYQPY
jgi:hypothetical protein